MFGTKGNVFYENKWVSGLFFRVRYISKKYYSKSKCLNDTHADTKLQRYFNKKMEMETSNVLD